MSTVVVGTIQSNSTSPPTFNNSGGTEIGTLCRAFVNFNGTGTPAIRASFNVSSITDNGTGNYTINFTNAMPDANYSWSGLCGTPAVTNGFQILGASAASNVVIATVNTTFNAADFTVVTVSVFR